MKIEPSLIEIIEIDIVVPAPENSGVLTDETGNFLTDEKGNAIELGLSSNRPAETA